MAAVSWLTLILSLRKLRALIIAWHYGESMKVAISSVVIAVCGLTVQSQSTSPTRAGRPDTVQREQQRQVEMQRLERTLTTEGGTPRSKRYPPAVLDVIRADFLQ